MDSGNLLRIDAAGNSTLFGTGFTSNGLAHEALADLAFGPDGALYVSAFNNDRILRIAPTAAIPEPSTLVLFGIGVLGMLGYYGWRRRKQAS